MRIRELLENKYFDHKNFVNAKEGNKREINYDLAEDLIHFAHNDDNTYRRHVYPVIADCIDRMKAKKSIHSEIFKPAVEPLYQAYLKKFPIRELPEGVDDKLCTVICKKMKEDFCKHYDDGKYKD
jgi:hypothetical protein